MIDVSIIMPARNADNFISQCIDSILKQSFQNWELIIINDFSEDTTSEVCQAYQKPDKRILCFDNVKRGIIPALQLGFEKSNGKYITRMDADDLMPPNKLTALFDKVQNSSKEVVTGKVVYFSDQPVSHGYLRYQNWLNMLVDSGDFFTSVYRECVVASPNWIVNRDCFENDFKFSDLKYPEDYDMVFHWYKFGYKISGIDKVTHLWREHEQRTSRRSNDYQQEAFFKIKTNYFLDLEISSAEKIQLVGAGKKGKLVAKILTKRKIEFDWFDFNVVEKYDKDQPQKIDTVINIKPNLKTILTSWPVDEKTQDEIRAFFESRNFVFGKNCWLF